MLIMLLGGAFDGDYSVVDLAQPLRTGKAATAPAENRWSRSTLQCRYNPAGAPVELDVVEAAILEAGRAWELKSGLKFEYAGVTSDLPEGIVYDCLISWDSFPNLFKLGEARNFRIDTELVGTDIRISKLAGADRLAMVLRHELGHGLGLKHDNEGCIMQASPRNKHLCFSDYARVSRLYPPYEVEGRPGLDCTVNLLPENEVYIPSIDGQFWARYKLNSDMSMTYIEHGRIDEDDLFMCK